MIELGELMNIMGDPFLCLLLGSISQLMRFHPIYKDFWGGKENHFCVGKSVFLLAFGLCWMDYVDALSAEN
jgi:hypothetical protein